jgi:hypothetical protein
MKIHTCACFFSGISTITSMTNYLDEVETEYKKAGFTSIFFVGSPK